MRSERSFMAAAGWNLLRYQRRAAMLARRGGTCNLLNLHGRDNHRIDAGKLDVCRSAEEATERIRGADKAGPSRAVGTASSFGMHWAARPTFAHQGLQLAFEIPQSYLIPYRSPLHFRPKCQGGINSARIKLHEGPYGTPSSDVSKLNFQSLYQPNCNPNIAKFSATSVA